MDRCNMGLVLLVFFFGFFSQEANALQCFVCTANRFLNKDCRSLASARLIDCPDTSTHCNAIVTDIDGMVTVNRGCSGNVFSWGFGNDECEIMTNQRIIDRAVAFYQCRGDGCNNIEPGTVTTVDKIVSDHVQAKVPQFSMASHMQSEHTMSGDSNLVSDSRAIVSDQETGMRMGKQAADSSSDDDDSYGLPGRERRTRVRTTTAPSTTTTTTTPTPKVVQKIRITTVSPPPATRPKRRQYTVFD